MSIAQFRILRLIAPALLVLSATSVMHVAVGHRIRIEILCGCCLALGYALASFKGLDKTALAPLLSGLLIALSCPDLNWWPISLVALIPLFIALERNEFIADAIASGILAGATTVLIGFSWGGRAFAGYCGISDAAGFLVFLPFCLLLSLKFPLFTCILHANRTRWKLPALVVVPLSYGAVEYAKFEIYPWYLGLGLSGSRHLSQTADLGGIVGLSAFVVLLNCLSYGCYKQLAVGAYRKAAQQAALAILSISAAWIYGSIRIHLLAQAGGREVRIAVVQPNTPGKILNQDVELKQHISENLYRLAMQAAGSEKPDLIVFAEASAIMGYQAGYNPEFVNAYRRIAAETSTPLLTDNVHFERDAGVLKYWRGALLLSPSGEIAGEYLKRRLVPFGEYIPFADTFPILESWFPYAKIYQRGTEPTLLDVDGVKIAPDICFEIIHPAATREHVGAEADLIINISNDSWYGSAKQARQHLALAIFRTIELRMPMIRATNTGISAFINAVGEIQKPASPIGTEWTANRAMRLPRLSSFYRRFGDLFGMLCILATIGFILGGEVFRRRRL